LIEGDLDYTCRRAGAPCYDIWEEELGRHYYMALVHFAALQEGAQWIASAGDAHRADRYRAAADRLAGELEAFWSAEQGIYRSRIIAPRQSGPKDLDQSGPKDLDMSVIFAVLHAGLESGPHSVRDQRVHATLRRLAALFAADYAINRGASAPFAYGRYRGDIYVSGGAYYFSSFAAAEFHYRLAHAAQAPSFIAAGDAILAGVRRFIPASGELSEQFDRTTGAQTSARNLSWSYASFITAWDARKRALDRGP
jgi:glucoamylase